MKEHDVERVFLTLQFPEYNFRNTNKCSHTPNIFYEVQLSFTIFMAPCPSFSVKRKIEIRIFN